MSKEINYKIFSESLQDPCYTLEDLSGNHLEFYRDSWANCKLTKNGKDLVKIDAVRYRSPNIHLNFVYETAINGIVFNVNNLRKFKLKATYHNQGSKEINWKWRISGLFSTKITLIDKNNNDKELGKIEEFLLTKGLSCSLIISYEVPSDFHTLIVASACLVVKFRHDSLTSKLSTFRNSRYRALHDTMALSF